VGDQFCSIGIDKNDYKNINMISGQLLLSVNVTNDLLVNEDKEHACQNLQQCQAYVF